MGNRSALGQAERDGQSSGGVGRGKSRSGGSNSFLFYFFSFLQHTFSNMFGGKGLASFRHEDDCSFWGIGYGSIADSEVLGGGWLSVGFQHFGRIGLGCKIWSTHVSGGDSL